MVAKARIPGGSSRVETFYYHPNRPMGNVFYVDSTHSNKGTSTAHGRSPEAPYSTLAAMLDSGLLTADNDDVIYLMPGHAETVSAAAGLDVDTAGISIIGIGRGTKQPKITFDTITTADMDIDAADILIENVHFSANFADLVAPIDVNATDFTIRKCRFSETAVNMNALIWILAATSTTSSRLTIEDCVAVDKDAANTSFVSFPGTSDGDVVRRNVLHVDCGTGVILAAGVITNCNISDNYIFNTATDVDSGINLAATATGVVMNNRIGMNLAGNVTTAVSAAGCACCENYVVDIGDRQGVLDPAAT